ncbi:MAG: hypothetical protein DRH11_05290 [Deltaproteobacteria bacterium]|nr:MAG: hypothetical protein DRH11_05290 [Deltaproteobacteria bacterium]
MLVADMVRYMYSKGGFGGIFSCLFTFFSFWRRNVRLWSHEPLYATAFTVRLILWLEKGMESLWGAKSLRSIRVDGTNRPGILLYHRGAVATSPYTADEAKPDAEGSAHN